MDRLSTEQFRTVSGGVARQVADEGENDNSAAPHGRSLRSVTSARENAKGANMAHTIPLIRDLEIRRNTLGWSIKELSDRCGIDENFLSDWACGLGSPRLDAIQPWAAALGLTLTFVPAESEAGHGLQVDWDKRCITLDGTPIRLTPMEWKTLERLAWTPGELVTHRALFHHLYGDDRHHRAQSTAVRVLITKLRRLLPIRIEAQWGQGYVISGLAPSRPQAHRVNDGISDGGTTRQPDIAEKPCDRVALKLETAPQSPPIRREPADINDSGTRRIAAAPTRPSSCRAEELGVIERFLAERGVTRCPDLTTIQQSPLPTLVWDKIKRKWVRPSASGCEAR